MAGAHDTVDAQL
jgi:hypothetical protein